MENRAAGNKQWVLRRLIVPEERLRNQRVMGTGSSSVSSDVGECILLFGAFCNGERQRPPTNMNTQSVGMHT